MEFKLKLQRACSCILFLLIASHLFVSTTYLFRISEKYNRRHIIGLKEEETLDMVYIGGSTVFPYWQPLKAWNDCGFTSYNYAVNSMRPEMLQYCVQEVLDTQDPELLVIGIRTFLDWNDAFIESGLRNVSDSMDFFSLNRWKMIRASLNLRNKDKTEAEMPYYFDIMKYHSNYATILAEPWCWEYRKNRKELPDKGWEWMIKYQRLETPDNFLTSKRAELDEECKRYLQDLLDTCKKSGCQVLFTVSPYLTSKEHQMQLNTMKDIIEENGFQYLNANEYYEKMDVDFSCDFYNGNHMNCIGAEKYTEFLEEYIELTYRLTDHRGDVQYDDWNEEYNRFQKEENVARKNTEVLIKEVQDGIDMAEIMRTTANAAEWGTLAQNDAFEVVIVSKGNYPKWDPYDASILQNIGVDVEVMWEMGRDSAALYADGNLIYLDKNEPYSTKFEKQDIFFSIDSDVLIQIGETQYCASEDGVYILVLQKNCKKCVADCIGLYKTVEDGVKLRHLSMQE
nr:hypothetical protein [uncultured Schaedlerella sp.]